MKSRDIPGKKQKDGQIEFTFCNTDSIFTTGSFVVNPKVGTLLLFPKTSLSGYILTVRPS